MKGSGTIFQVLASLFLLLLLNGCGGGTSGSGLKSYDGIVASTDGTPLTGVNVTITSTGDSGVTNEKGEFSIASHASGDAVEILLESPMFSNSFVVKNVPTTSSRVRVNVKVDTAQNTVQVEEFGVRAGIVGLCDTYFENNEVIRQANEVPKGTICTIKLKVYGDGDLRSHIPVALQYAACPQGSPWTTLATGMTGVGTELGSEKLSFTFIDSPEFCRYRVIAPYKFQNYRGVKYPLETFSYQRYLATH